MDFFKNRELRGQVYLAAFLLILGTSLGFFVSFKTGLLLFVFLLLVIVLHFMDIIRRYKRMHRLSTEMDYALHGDKKTYFDDFCEGEVSILQNELQKLMTRLHEQNEALQLERAQMADFLADVSHQIRTPLTALQLTFSTLLEESDERERRRHLNEARRLLSRIDWLIEALLKLAKLDAGIVQFREDHVSFEVLAKKTLEPFQIAMELKNQTAVLDLAGGFVGDLSWTTEAVSNIVKNCLEHMRDGGTLTLKAKENAVYAELVIEDDGCGIDDEDLPYLFDRFYKGKHSGEQSVGIGLALARRIVTGQNGIIKAENRKHGGARFLLRFYRQNV